jgi:DNA-binding NarL/FixJ family response regulator
MTRDLLKGAKVLVVDDDHFAVRVFARALEEAGCRVRGAADLEQGRAEIESDTPDAAVIDLKLADENGGALILELRAKKDPTSALLVTAARSLEATRQAIAVGAEEVLLKPFDTESFLDAVARTIERTHAWRKALHSAAWGNRKPTVSGGDIMPPKPRSATNGTDGASGTTERLVARLKAAPMDVEVAADRLAQLGELSDRERTIVVHALFGLRAAQIAIELAMTERTVKFHLTRVYRKLGIAGRADLTRFLF